MVVFLAFVSQAQAAKLDAEFWYGIEYHVTISGELKAGDGDKLKQLVLAQFRAGHLISQFNIYPPGGSVDEAFKMGEQIQVLAVPTNAPESQPDGTPRCTMGSFDTQRTRPGSYDCQSACFLVWDRPHFEPDDKSVTLEQIEQLEQRTREYLRTMKLPEPAVQKLFQVPSGTIRKLSTDEIDEMRNSASALDEYISRKCHVDLNKVLSSNDTKVLVDCRTNEIDDQLIKHANDYLKLYGNPSEVFIKTPLNSSTPTPTPTRADSGRTDQKIGVVSPHDQGAEERDERGKEECQKPAGDHVIVEVRYEISMAA